MQSTQPNIQGRRLSPEAVRTVAPALEAYTQERLYGDVWKRPDLTPRDRSLVTVAALIARGQAPALTYYLNQAIENGVKPREISETITHLAFAGGPMRSRPLAPRRCLREAGRWRRSASASVRATAAARRDNRRSRSCEAGRRAVRHGRTRGRPIHHRGTVSGSLAAPRSGASGPESRDRERPDRHGAGRAAALSPEPGDGLTQPQAAEVLTHLAFYTGWPSVFSALPVAKDVFEKRAR